MHTIAASQAKATSNNSVLQGLPFQVERSLLKLVAPKNIELMYFTLLTGGTKSGRRKR
jgi:hypothetical protein